jgi:hypothetical protein
VLVSTSPMPSYINEELQRLLALRTDYLSDSCLIYKEHTIYRCEVGHIISVKHGGPSETNNMRLPV